MKKKIQLPHHSIPYTLRLSPRARRLRISVTRDAQVRVTVPRKMPLWIVERFMIGQASWIVRTLEEVRKQYPIGIRKDGDREYKKYKEEARVFIHQRLAYFNRIYQFPFHRVSIKNQKTRWGSCSRQGNLNFNYRLLFLPSHLADYIIVHEICHLKELNHSSRFWQLVAHTIAEYKERRQELRKTGVQFY